MRGNAVVDENGSLQKGKDNATMISNPINGNSIITKAKATSYESGLSLARGMTAPIEYFDEPEFTNHIGTIISNSVSTYETAAANAKRNNGMYARIFTCTPKLHWGYKTSLIAGNSEVDNQQPRLLVIRVRFNDYRKHSIEEISI